MDSNDKASSLFSQLPVPVSFCCLDIGSDRYEYATQVVSVLPNGFVITSPRKLRRGSLLSLRLRIPCEISRSLLGELRCTGCVVAEQQHKSGALAYQVEMETPPLPA